MATKPKTMTFYYRGRVERGTGGPGYAWREGYSENGPNGEQTQPWNTYRECQAIARSVGARAVFVRN